MCIYIVETRFGPNNTTPCTYLLYNNIVCSTTGRNNYYCRTLDKLLYERRGLAGVPVSLPSPIQQNALLQTRYNIIIYSCRVDELIIRSVPNVYSCNYPLPKDLHVIYSVYVCATTRTSVSCNSICR